MQSWILLATGIALSPLLLSLTELQSCGATTTPLSNADVVLEGVEPYASAGPVVSAGDINGDGYGDILVGSSHAPGLGGPGRVYLFHGPLSGSYTLWEADEVMDGETAGDLAGLTIAPLGDFNQDGFDDFMVGAPGATVEGKTSAGIVYVIYGPVNGRTSLSQADLNIQGQAMWNSVSQAVPAGDVNGDGYPDLAIGSTCGVPLTDGAHTTPGCTHVFWGPLSRGPHALGSANVILKGEGDFDNAFLLTPGGDLNGDGFDDLLVGAPDHVNSTGSIGCLYVLYGPMSSTSSLANANGRIISDVPVLSGADSVGMSTSLGDANGDGHLDILTSAIHNDLNGYNAGVTGLFYGPFPTHFASLMSESDSALMGDEGGESGSTVSMAGDVDGDGYDDLLISAPWDDTGGPDAGAIYLVYGPPPASVVLSEEADEIFMGATSDLANCQLGRDLTGDGLKEITCTARYHDSTGGQDSGEMYVFFGGRR